MSRKLKLLSALVAAPLVFGAAHADNSGHFTVTPMLGYQSFDNILKNDAQPQIALGYRFANQFGVELVYNQGTSGLVDSRGNRFTNQNGTKDDGTLDYSQVRLDGQYFIPMVEATRWSPYVAAGIGQISLEGNNLSAGSWEGSGSRDGEAEYIQYNVGGGLQYAVTPSLNIRGDARYLSWSMGSGLTPANTGGDNSIDDYQIAAGLNWLLGVNEVAPAPVPVPVVPPVVEPKIVDTDNDGVIDELDKCPGTAAGVRVGTRGCALDTDLDGVADGLDQCPTTPAGDKVDPSGCTIVVTPPPAPPVCSYVSSILDGVEFQSGSDRLTSSAEAILIGDAAKLVGTTGTIEVQGHTDSQGAEAFNQQLSERRAQSVAAFLAANGVDASRISSVGYGESSPIDTNATAAGRTNNRRVELLTQSEVCN